MQQTSAAFMAASHLIENQRVRFQQSKIDVKYTLPDLFFTHMNNADNNLRDIIIRSKTPSEKVMIQIVMSDRVVNSSLESLESFWYII